MHLPARGLSLLILLAFTPCRAQTVPVIAPAGSVPGTWPGNIEVAELHDADADGLLDLVSRTDFPLQFSVQRNLGGGAFGPPIISPTLSEDVKGTAFADLDMDGVMDAVVSNPCLNNVNLCVFKGDGVGGLELWDAINNNSLAYPLVALGDLDGDGDGDIVSTTYTQISAQLQQGVSFMFGKLSAPCQEAGVPVLADFDMDGFLDMVQVSDSLDTQQALSDMRLNLGNGLGEFFNVQAGTLDVQAQRTQMVNLDADGQPDLMVFGPGGSEGGEGGLYLFRNEGGSLQLVSHESVVELGPLTQDVSGADLNQDGSTELLIVRSGPTVGANEIRMNDVFDATHVTVPFSGPADGALGVLGDVDGDELADVAVLGIPVGSAGSWNFWHNATPVPTLWIDLGQGLAGAEGVPSLDMEGSLVAQQPLSLALGGAAPQAPVLLVLGASVLAAPFKGGTMVPTTDLVLAGLVTDSQGSLLLVSTWPAGVPSGIQIVLQVWIVDAEGPKGFAASNAQMGVVP